MDPAEQTFQWEKVRQERSTAGTVMVMCLAGATCIVTVPGLPAPKGTVMTVHSLPSVDPQPRKAPLCPLAREGIKGISMKKHQPSQPFSNSRSFLYN